MTKARVIGIRIDIETRSREDIKTAGVYRYAECPDFKVLIVRYCHIRQYPGGATKLGRIRELDLDDAGQCAQFEQMLYNTRFQKHAFNAQFERVALSKWMGLPNGVYLDPKNWHCSAVRANANGVFGTLDDVARAVRSPIAKDPEGKRLIRFFSVPQKDGSFNEPADHPTEFAKYGDYCTQDVMTEAVVASQFPDFPPEVQAEYEADQRINDRGVRHFKALSEAAVAAVAIEKDRVMDELRDLTGVENPNSPKQMSEWLEERGYPMLSLDKTHREEALNDPLVPDEVAEALTLKGQASLTSVSKHKAALATRCADGRIRGSLRFYGAHTGREAGRGIQPQNLPRFESPRSDVARLLHGRAGSDAPQIAKGSVRQSLVPAKGNVFVTADYNAIEARTLGWAAGELWVNDEFVNGQGKIYEATSAVMFAVDKAQLIASLKACDKCGKTTCPSCSMRSRGKVSNLALGYAGGAGALVTMGAEAAGIDIGNYNELHAVWVAAGKPGKFHEWNREAHDYPELLRLRDLYRETSPATVRFWKLCAKAWDISALTGKGAAFGSQQQFSMIRDGKHNRLVLPSGRSIWYRYAKAHAHPDDPDRIDRRTFMGKSKGVGQMRTDTHGGKLTENLNQAIARDVLFDLLMKIEAMTATGWPGKTVLHVHDEVVLEVPKASAQQVLDDVLGLMDTPPDWAVGLAVKGEGAIMERYGK